MHPYWAYNDNYFSEPSKPKRQSDGSFYLLSEHVDWMHKNSIPYTIYGENKYKLARPEDEVFLVLTFGIEDEN